MSEDRDARGVFPVTSIDLGGRMLRSGETLVVQYTVTYGDDGDAVIDDVSASVEGSPAAKQGQP